MIERDGYMAGVPCWVDTSRPDPPAAVDFYGGLFGWDLDDTTPPGLPGHYLVARIRGGAVAAVGFPPDGGPQEAVWNTYVAVESADDTAGRVLAAGGSVLIEPFDISGAGRTALLADPAGALFYAWEERGFAGARIVNEHGALNFNDLHTPDPEGARSFYAAVFGWETLVLDGGFAMWMLPGYCDYLEQSSPGLREGMAEMGAPAGFEDVVATLNPIPADQAGTPSHWGVTFAVEDADATAARVAELGGRVLAGPFDAPWVRMAVIADPGGATFTASQFVPENKSLTQTGDAPAVAPEPR